MTFGPLARSLGIAAITQQEAARVAALMYGAGALMVLASLVVPHDAAINAPVVTGVAVIAAAVALLFALAGSRMTPGRVLIANLGGTALISVIVAFGGDDSTSYAMLYVWAAIYAFYFFDIRFAVLAAIWIVVAAGVAEAFSNHGPEQASAWTAWLMAVGTSAVAGLVIQDLVRRLLLTASVDPLTGAANRGSWDAQLERAVALSRRQKLRLTVLMLDLDRFKVYNDDYGHLAGDAILAEAVKGWRPELRQDDFLARYGGEEFAILLAGCGLDDSLVIAERLRAAMPGGQTCSIGIAELEPGDDGASMVARADAALYKAKMLGRDCAVTAGAAVVDSDVLAETSRWASTVQAVLTSGRTPMAYQPIRRLDTGSLLGMEALARPYENDLTVEGLFATAQRMGRSRDLDWACRHSALMDAGALPAGALIFINVAAASLVQDPEAAQRMAGLAQQVGIDPHRVVLEVTERENILRPAQLAEVLETHRRYGFKIAVDDVGEGHSTFELLASLVPDYVKVAASLVRRLDEPGPRSAIMAAAMFATSSGAELIAEGIENAETAQTLGILGARYGQGYHLGRPQLPDPNTERRAAELFAPTIIAPSPIVAEPA